MQVDLIPGFNLVLGAPKGHDPRGGVEIVGLPVIRTDWGFVSQWRPTEAELAAMQGGAPVLLHLLGDAHPPVAIEVGAVEKLNG